jgi:energy-converting hydrogenase Eha subunit C
MSVVVRVVGSRSRRGNAEIVSNVTEQIVEHTPNPIMVVVSNPLDEMTFLTALASGLLLGLISFPLLNLVAATLLVVPLAVVVLHRRTLGAAVT